MHERFHAEPFSEVHTMPDRLSKPLRWRKPRVVFVCNTSDLFHPDVPFEFIAAVFGVMAACPQHTFLVLTKRPERMREFFFWWAGIGARMVLTGETGALVLDHQLPRNNVWLGVTVENVREADRRLSPLRLSPAAHHWVSFEPLLELIDSVNLDGIDQVIIGGESGPRPCNVEWIRSLRDQCRDAGVPCFVKQLGSNAYDRAVFVDDVFAGGVRRTVKDRAGADPSEWPEDLRVRELAWRKSW
jgi:protein gp37